MPVPRPERSRFDRRNAVIGGFATFLILLPVLVSVIYLALSMPLPTTPAMVYPAPQAPAGDPLIMRLAQFRYQEGGTQAVLGLVDRIEDPSTKDLLLTRLVALLAGESRSFTEEIAPPPAYPVPAPMAPYGVEPYRAEAPVIPSAAPAGPARPRAPVEADPMARSFVRLARQEEHAVAPPVPVASEAEAEPAPPDEASIRQALTLIDRIDSDYQKLQALRTIAEARSKSKALDAFDADLERITVGVLNTMHEEGLAYHPSMEDQREVAETLRDEYEAMKRSGASPADLRSALREAATEELQEFAELRQEPDAMSTDQVVNMAMQSARDEWVARQEANARRFWAVAASLGTALLTGVGFVLTGLITPLLNRTGELVGDRVAGKGPKPEG